MSSIAQRHDSSANAPHALPILIVRINSELDVIASRQRARHIALCCGFSQQDQTRISTAVSELARNIFNYAGSGRVRFSLVQERNGQALVVAVEDRGPGIDHLDSILDGSFHSPTGLGRGILAAHRLMDRCDIVTGNGDGTTITLSKRLPNNAAPMTPAALADIVSQLGALPSNVALSEAHQQNRELNDALLALQQRQDDLLKVTQRLEETNRKVEALNLLLDEKANQLLAADSKKDEFLAILSHELRGPLSAAGMAAHLLEAEPHSADGTVRLSQVVKRQVDHMSRLVEDLLDVSRVSRGLVLIDKAPVDLCAVIGEAVEQASFQAREKRHAIAVHVSCITCIIHGDKARLVQVVSNLLNNAIRYTPDDGRISVRLDAGERSVSIEVTDNGIGIAREIMANLFDLYVQAERSSNRTGSGLGLGLALVKSLVDAHGGSVSASSDGAGLGSTFGIAFPLPA